MARRPCAEPGCPVITDNGRCDKHARCNANARGYDAQHQRESRRLKALVRAGTTVLCWRCGQPITDPDDLDLGHHEGGSSAEHARACNRSAAGRASHGLAPRNIR